MILTNTNERNLWPPPTNGMSDVDKRKLLLVASDLVKHLADELQVPLIRRLNFVLVNHNCYEAHTKLGMFVVEYDHNRDRASDFAPAPWRTRLPLLSSSDNRELMIHRKKGQESIYPEFWSGNKDDAMRKAQVVYEELIGEGIESGVRL